MLAESGGSTERAWLTNCAQVAQCSRAWLSAGTAASVRAVAARRHAARRAGVSAYKVTAWTSRWTDTFPFSVG